MAAEIYEQIFPRIEKTGENSKLFNLGRESRRHKNVPSLINKTRLPENKHRVDFIGYYKCNLKETEEIKAKKKVTSFVS